MRISDWSSDVCSSDLILAFGEIAAAFILHDEHIAALHRLIGIAQRRPAQLVLVVRRLPQDGGQRSPGIARREDIGRQADPVAHRHHHRSAAHTSELQSLMRISYAVICLKNKTTKTSNTDEPTPHM